MPTGVINPVDELIVAVAELLLVHVPPAVAFVHVAVLPRHIRSVPAGAVGCVFTVIVFWR